MNRFNEIDLSEVIRIGDKIWKEDNLDITFEQYINKLRNKGNK